MKLTVPVLCYPEDLKDDEDFNIEDSVIRRAVVYNVAVISRYKASGQVITQIDYGGGDDAALLVPMKVKEVEEAVDKAMELGFFDLYEQWKQNQI